MESRLKIVTDACTCRFGEEGLGRKIAAHVREVFILESLERINNAVDIKDVWKELRDRIGVECVCSLALEVMGMYVKGTRQGSIEQVALHRNGSVETVLTSMNKHQRNESIQGNGSFIIEVLSFFGVNGDIVASPRCIRTLLTAMRLFPSSAFVQVNVLKSIHFIHQTFLCSEMYAVFYSRLLAADALSLALTALENHADIHSVVRFALIIFGKCNGMNCPNMKRTVLEFAKDHPSIETVIYPWYRVTIEARAAFAALGLPVPP